jgi:hypothetical protein
MSAATLEQLRVAAPRDVVLTAAGRRDVFELLWLLRGPFSAALTDALALAIDPVAPYHEVGNAFVARSLAHVRSGDELVALCEGIDDAARGDLLGVALKGFSLDPRVLVTLLEDAPLVARLAPGSLWCSDALWRRAAWLFEEHPKRRFDFDELVPPGLPEGTSARAVLGAALDRGCLTDEAVAQVRARYVGDMYIQQKTTPPA